jgi:3-phenylpropionate/trans-cinnamate dioxygenase ferredoxin reductase subunit
MAASSLRSFGYDGQITMIGAEPDLPYERPELSKAYLSGASSFDKLQILSSEQMSELDISFFPNETVTEFSLDQRTLATSTGRSQGFDHLILATGGAPRPLEGCHTLRSKEDADQIRSRLAGAKSLGIIGAGWLGLEVAAHARTLNLATTVYEMSETLCSRVLPRTVSDQLAAYHLSTGVQLVLGVTPDMEHVHANHDLVVACVGMVPHDGLARAAGLQCDHGILVDKFQQTSAHGVFAIGDCARPRGGTRPESWAYANRSAKRAAAAITGVDVGREESLWFWSKQGSLSLQMIGECSEALKMTREETLKGGQVWRFQKAGRQVGLIAINSPREFASARRQFVE